MEVAIWTTVSAAVASAATFLIPKLLEYMKQRSDETLAQEKLAGDERKSETEQALSMYRELIEGLKVDIRNLMTELDKLNKEHASCREENAALRAEVKALTARIEQLEKKT